MKFIDPTNDAMSYIRVNVMCVVIGSVLEAFLSCLQYDLMILGNKYVYDNS